MQLFQKLATQLPKPAPGCIHTLCNLCGQRETNARRADHDVPEAVLVESACANHGDDERWPDIYYGADGRELGPEAGAAALVLA